MNAIEIRNVSKRFCIPHERHATLAGRLLALFRPNRDQLVSSANTRLLGVETGRLMAGERRRFDIRFTAALANGRYAVTLAAIHDVEDTVYDWVNHATSFVVVRARCGDGASDLGAEFSYAEDTLEGVGTAPTAGVGP
jgi:Wzt C-terminal domain